MAVTTNVPAILESGDRLTRCEFHRRYSERTDTKKAELVEGVVYVPSPLRMYHGEPHGLIMTWLGVYKSRHPELRLGDNVTVFLDAYNEVQPDACLFRVLPSGPRQDEEGYVEGAPQLVVEIVASSAAYDLHDKLRAYRRGGVREYVTWRVFDRAIDWRRLHDGDYVRIEPDEHGIIENTTFPGLRLHVTKMLDEDLAGVLAELARGSDQDER